jgi:phosphatidylglycerophosphatase A
MQHGSHDTPPDGVGKEPPDAADGQADTAAASDNGADELDALLVDDGEPPIDPNDPALPRLLHTPAFWIASGFGAGLVPRAPGTVGTLVAALPWLLMRDLPWPAYVAIVAATFAIGVWAAQRVIDILGAEDPGVVVIDEWIGLWITLFLAPPGWEWLLIGIALFRVFDIVKPWPVSWADTRLHGGFGAMLDDALAGIYALIALQLLALGFAML